MQRTLGNSKRQIHVAQGTKAAQAAENSRSPNPRRMRGVQSLAPASWSAAVLCRFDCRSFAVLLVAIRICTNLLLADDWPQWLGPNRDSIWRESGIIEKFPTNGPPVIWRMAIGSGYSGPSVSHGRVYVTDRQLAVGVNNPSD